MVSSTAVIAALLSTGLLAWHLSDITGFPVMQLVKSAMSRLDQALAAGGLLGDVFLHTPSAFGNVEAVQLMVLLRYLFLS
jgi:hypothetical protein